MDDSILTHLPRNENDAVAADAKGAASNKTSMNKTALIVEDNELNMKLFHDLLETHGYQILRTRDGLDAVTVFAMKGDKEKVRQEACEAYVAKPISVSQFMETVERFLN